MARGQRTGFSEERMGPYLRGRRDGLGPHREEENQEAKESADERVEEEGEELERLAERADAVDGAVVDAAEGGGERETDEEAGDEAVDRKQLRPKGGTVERPSEKEENVDGEEKVAKGNESVKTRGEVAVGVLDLGLPFEQDVAGRRVTERYENNVLPLLRHVPAEVDLLRRASRRHVCLQEIRKGDGLVLALANLCLVDNELVVVGTVPALVFRGREHAHIESMSVAAIQKFLPFHNADGLIDRVGKNEGLKNDPHECTLTSISPRPKRWLAAFEMVYEREMWESLGSLRCDWILAYSTCCVGTFPCQTCSTLDTKQWESL